MRDRRPHPSTTGHALRRVRRALKKGGAAGAKFSAKSADAAAAKPARLTEWEAEFLGSVADRLQTYGSAFVDPNLGSEEEALSVSQEFKLREISRSLRRKAAQTAPATAKQPVAKKPVVKPRLAPSAGPGKKGGGLRRKSPLRAKTPFGRKPPRNGS